MGNVLQAGLGQNTARQSAIGAGLAESVPSTTINKVCGSGLKTVALAAQAIRAGDAECLVAGGMENMSRAPYLMENGRYGYRLGHGQLVDEMIRDGLWCAFDDCHMGSTAENIAREYEVSREDQDSFAAGSQQKAEAAIKSGRFKDEIVPVPVQRKKETVLVDTDEHPRPGTTAETLAALRAAFAKDGTVTAGNASGINDGAAAVVVMSASRAKAENRVPLARIRGYSSAGVRAADHGDGTRARSESRAAESRRRAARHRPLRTQRSIRRASRRRWSRARRSRGPPQRQWRRDRHRTSHRRQRDAHPRHPALRDGRSAMRISVSQPCASAAARASRWCSSEARVHSHG